MLRCPDCASTEVTTEHHQSFMANSGEHHCHTMKTHDAQSPASCTECGWEGVRENLEEDGEGGWE